MDRQLSILYVAYPLLTVTEDSAGGAEQMLWSLEREMARAGHRTTVAASNGSRVSGDLLSTGAPVSDTDQYQSREREHCERVLNYLQEHPHDFDLIHDESGSFWRHAEGCPLPMLATFHLPRTFYREEWFRDLPPNLYFNCVSYSQARTFSDMPNLLGVVQNGILLERFQCSQQKQNYLLWLGRICEEKGPHLAIVAAKRAHMPLVLAGQIYPFRYHQQYFEHEIKPRLCESSDPPVLFVDSPAFAMKADLLRHARALLLTSTAEETSSLVALEAMACGTPVIALRRGAAPEIVADGLTGFVVDRVEEMAEALGKLGRISAHACRARVEECFGAERMKREYEVVYREVLARAAERTAA